jgi:hypothetical protein
MQSLITEQEIGKQYTGGMLHGLIGKSSTAKLFVGLQQRPKRGRRVGSQKERMVFLRGNQIKL